MARHRDLNRASSLLEGSQGWIIENHPEAITDPNKKRNRRSKKKRIYHKSGFCNYAHATCMGVDCGSYSEEIKEREHNEP